MTWDKSALLGLRNSVVLNCVTILSFVIFFYSKTCVNRGPYQRREQWRLTLYPDSGDVLERMGNKRLETTSTIYVDEVIVHILYIHNFL